MKYERLDGYQKAAILTIAIGVDAASQLFQNLSENDIERITAEIAAMKEVSAEIIDKVVEEFIQLIRAQQFISVGGVEYATKLLRKAVGEERALEIVKRVASVQEEKRRGFQLLRRADHNHILNLISNEHPQTISLVLAYLEPNQAAQILANLPPNKQQDIVYRIATMEKISSDLLWQIEEALKDQIESSSLRELSETEGKKTVANILNMAGKSVEKSILEALHERSPALAQEIRALMFTFEDIQKLDDRSLQRFLKEVDTKLLTIALKGSTEEIQDRIFANMSQRAAAMIKDEMEYMGPLRVKEVEEAQRQLVEVIRKLEEEGEIVIMMGGDGDGFVV